MTDERVDELLADLDRALGVEPSPSVSASVRMRIDRTPADRWGQSWLLVAASVVIVAAGALLWRRPPESHRPAAAVAAMPVVASAVQPLGANPSPTPPRLARTTAAREPGPARGLSSTAQTVEAAAREPDVIISADQRIALEQLRAALNDGRLNANSFVAVTPLEPRRPLNITPVIVAPFKADVVTWPDDVEMLGQIGGGIRRD